MAKFLVMVLGFIIGVSATLALEFGLLFVIGEVFHSRFVPRGFGWFMLPFFVGFAVARIAPEVPEISKFIKEGLLRSFWATRPLTRFMIVAPIFWVVGVGLYVLIFEPYGYMTSSDYRHMAKVMMFPPVILVAAYFVYIKLISPNSRGESNET